MASTYVYFNDVLQQEVPLNRSVTTIGRKEGSDIKIDNLAVSSFHAKIVHDGNNFYIEDTHSKNGTFLNGHKISRQQLKHGDIIAICKHTLKFIARKPSETIEEVTDSAMEQKPDDPSMTMNIDVSKMREMLHLHRINDSTKKNQVSARLMVMDRSGQRQTYSISNSDIKIGKRDCDIALQGWFVPRIAAIVRRKPEGYFLIPHKRGKVYINDNPIRASERLKDGDEIKVRNLFMQFYISIRGNQ